MKPAQGFVPASVPASHASHHWCSLPITATNTSKPSSEGNPWQVLHGAIT